ncbi:MAG: ATP:cob(I)alamin adenosyltransferase, partial [Candidatus Azotimanducaceae bacterium WSBS_2022_MAG_OTU7]
ERNVALLAESEHVNTASKEFLNRLSDYLFVVARSCARITGVDEVLWQKG